MKKLITIEQLSGSLEVAFSKIPYPIYNEEKNCSEYFYKVTLVSTVVERGDEEPTYIFTFEVEY